MLLSVFISLLVGVAHAHWWDHKYQWNGQWYDCTSWEDGQWWWRGVSGGGERQGPCQLYSGTGYSYNNGYNYWDPYSVSYRRCDGYRYRSEKYGWIDCGPTNHWWAYKHSWSGAWYDCGRYDLNAPTTAASKWYHERDGQKVWCTDYHDVMYDWSLGYNYWDTRSRQHYRCALYLWSDASGSGSGPKACGLPATYTSGYTGGSNFGQPGYGGPEGGY